MNTIIQAHRGASAYRPENTLDAFALAVEQKADAVELDVHLTRDGHVVVAHDDRLERVSDGQGYVADHTLEQLKALNFGALYPERPRCAIPTLGEVYALLKDTPLRVNVELKTTTRLYPELPEKLIRLEREYGMEGRVMYSSFNHYSLSAIKAIDTRANIGLLYNIGLIDPWVYASYAAASAIHPHYTLIAALPDTVARCHDHGVKVNVWTVDDEQTMALMFRCGVDSVITNRPDVAVALRDSM